MMNHDERARYILGKLKREKARQKRLFLRFATLTVGVLAMAGITGILFFATPASVPATGGKSDINAVSKEKSLTESQDPGETSKEASSGHGPSSGAPAESTPSEDASIPETPDPQPDFSSGKGHLLSKEDVDFDVPLILSEAGFDAALKNASAAFEGKIVGFGPDLTSSAAGPLITLHVAVNDGYRADFPVSVPFLCPCYYLPFLEEENEYLFLMFDYKSAGKFDGCDRFAVIDAAGFACLVDETEVESLYPKVVSAADFRAYFSQGRQKALDIYETIKDPGAVYTAVLEGADYKITLVRDNWGEGVFVFSGEKETRFYRPAGEDAVYIAEFENTRIRKIAGFDAAYRLTEAVGFFLEKAGAFPDYTKALAAQQETNFYDFSDGNRLYSLCAEGETAGFYIEGVFTSLSLFTPRATESAAAAGEMVNLDLSLAYLQETFTEEERTPPENLSHNVIYGYEESMTALTGLLFSYGEGVRDGENAPYALVQVWVTNTLYGETEKLETLSLPAYFTGRLDAEKEYLFVFKKGGPPSPLGVLEINEDGTLSSPLGSAYDGGALKLLTLDDYMIYYDENHIAADRIARAFTGLGNGLLDTEPFDMAYRPVDLYLGVSEESAEVRVTYLDGTLTLGFYSEQSGFVGYFRDNIEEGLFRYDENGEKVYPKASEYLEKSMIISYIISVTALKESPGFVKSGGEIAYETLAGNRLVLGMEDGKLQTITLNGSLLAQVSTLDFN